MATKVRILAVVLAAVGQTWINEAFTLDSNADSSTEADVALLRRERIRHRAALANISRHMTVAKALEVFQARPGAPAELVSLVSQGMDRTGSLRATQRRAGAHTEPSGEADPATAAAAAEAAAAAAKKQERTRELLNNMIYEVQTQYEIEHKKCCDYERSKRTLIEDAAQDIALFNSESASARAEILNAQSLIGIAEGKIPKLREALTEHNEKCDADVTALEKELAIVSDDRTTIESLSDTAKCPEEEGEGGLKLIQCLHPCTQETHILFSSKVARAALRKLKSKSARELVEHRLTQAHHHHSKNMKIHNHGHSRKQQKSHQHHVSNLLQTELEKEMVDDYNTKVNGTEGPLVTVPTSPCQRPPPTDSRSAKCTLGAGNCQIVTERLLTIHMGIIDKQRVLKQEIHKLEGTCKEVKTSLESQISDFSTQLSTQQGKLAAATKKQNTADEQNRLKSVEKADMEKEFAEMTTTCHTNYQSLENQECGLKKIRGEVFKKWNPDKDPVFEDCQLSEWAEEECSKSCGGGEQKLSRTIVTMPNGGVKCLPLEEKQACNQQQCPIDCKVGDWESWSGCTAECGGGVMQRGRLLEAKPKYGGKPCGETSEVRSCNIASCNADCKLSEWTEWSHCSKGCGGGRQRRLKFIADKARGTGKCPSEKDEGRLQYMECNTKACPEDLKCETTLDVVVLLDGSARIGADGWSSMKEAGEQLVLALGISEHVNIAVVLFSGPKTLNALSACTNEDPTAPPPDLAKQCHISTVSPLTGDAEAVAAKIKTLKWPAGSALTSVALTVAEAELALGRKDANSVVLVVTRGKPLSVDQTTAMAKQLKRKARLMWVPILGHESADIFSKWSSDPDDENIIPVKDFAQLKEAATIDKIVASMCPVISAPAPAPPAPASSSSSSSSSSEGGEGADAGAQ